MNIETVNELIASLEGGGELSIREQKFLKLAKAHVQLAAENVDLKAEQVRIFNSGYLRGHESTVEGYYVDIHQDDITTYHEDIVAEISEEQTPVTDRIVAGIKADAIDEAAVELDRVDTVASTRVIGFKLREFSQQLREGAK
ncbi:TPA: hypothetical protein PCI40_001296 [Klebsiella pneumoniae]|nr:hypothetical protein [Klebsiella pneumoniae]HDE1409307.1 hypothetical protein [Klebsiella pneumoniae]HDG7428094.1 hypothetical protein [Klebsiella pneumoniae]HDG7494306.1 hypothetical protein [Klebsiella pneumoniae]